LPKSPCPTAAEAPKDVRNDAEVLVLTFEEESRRSLARRLIKDPPPDWAAIKAEYLELIKPVRGRPRKRK
jgi:hypothetical protein